MQVYCVQVHCVQVCTHELCAMFTYACEITVSWLANITGTSEITSLKGELPQIFTSTLNVCEDMDDWVHTFPTTTLTYVPQELLMYIRTYVRTHLSHSFPLSPSLQRCPHYRGVLTTEVSSLQGCPHYRGVLTTEVPSLQRCPHYRGVFTTGVSSLQGCPHYRGVLTTEVSSLQRCPTTRGVLTTQGNNCRGLERMLHSFPRILEIFHAFRTSESTTP